MAEQLQLKHPWFIAIWPGMGNVALNAGYYLLSKLDMKLVAEFEGGDLFDINHVEVKSGRIQPIRKPGNRLFVWHDPNEKHDLVVFLGEAQPPIGKYSFCRQLIDYARKLGVERVFTFAAMATQMHPDHPSRVFGAATDETNLAELKRLELELLEDGNIGGLNGILLGVAMDQNLQGVCMLGEMPHIFAQLPFPKASLAILEVFTTMSGIDLDLSDLQEQAEAMNQQLGELLARVEQAYQQQQSGGIEEGQSTESTEEQEITRRDAKRIEAMFIEAQQDRTKAYELKQELDRLGVFKDYEDRFLDLFKKAG